MLQDLKTGHMEIYSSNTNWTVIAVSCLRHRVVLGAQHSLSQRGICWTEVSMKSNKNLKQSNIAGAGDAHRWDPDSHHQLFQQCQGIAGTLAFSYVRVF